MTEDKTNFTHQWQRVSALSIVYFFMSRGLGIIKELGMNAAPVFVGLLVAVEDKVFWFTVAGLGFLALIIIDVVALYLTFRYRVEGNQIVVKQGVFTKEILNLKYARVQNINNAVPWYFKPFNLVRCSLDSAGSSAKEVDIPGITRARSDAIAAIIHTYQQSHDIDIEENTSEAITESDNTLKLTNWEVTKFGFTNSMIFVFAGAIFPVVEKITETTGIDFTDYLKEIAALLPLPDIIAKIVLVLLSMVVFAFILLSITALGSFVRFHNYELYDEGKKLKRVAGLLERQTIYLNKTKVQGISIKQNVFAKMLGMVSVYFQQTQADGKSMGKKQPFIIPMLKPNQWQNILKFIYPELVEKELKFTSIEPQYFSRTVIYGFLLPVSLLALPLVYFISKFFLLFYLLGVPIIAIAYLRYRRYGHCVAGDYLIIRNGIIGTNYHILHRFKAQHMTESTSPSQRRLNLGSMNIQMAYSVIQLPYMRLSDIRQIINQNLYLTESTHKSWM